MLCGAFRPLALVAVATCACLLPAPSLWAQNDNVLPADGTDGLTSEYRTHRALLPPLFKGEINIRTEEQKERYNKAIDCEARWVMYRFTWRSEFHGTPGLIDRLVREAESDLNNLDKYKPDTQYVLEQFSKRLVVHGKEVLQTNQLIARLNAARVLEKAASKGGAQNELADLFTELLDAKETNEGVKFYAMRGLRNLFALPRPKIPILTRDREEKAILTLLEFVERKAVFTPVAPRDEVEGFRSLRREAIRALAMSRYPSVADKGRTGLVLLRAAVRDGLVPEPRFDEQMEAALGVTRLQPQLDPSYQKDYAVAILGRLIVDIGSMYQAEKDKKDRKPYKYYAAKLLEGLELMKAETKNKPVDKYARDAAIECAKVLSKIEGEGTPVPFDLGSWLEKNPPPNKQLYQGGADSTVTPAGRREAAEPAS